MEIESTQVSIKFDLRQAQSLLIMMREIEGMNFSWNAISKLPKGVKDDIKTLKLELETLLMMADQRR